MSDSRGPQLPGVEVLSSSSGGTSKATSPTRAGRTPSSAEYDGLSNSNSNASPTRPSNGSTSVPSAAAVQRALSVTKTATASNDSSSDVARDRRQRSGPNTPHWPVSPRLKSPPPMSLRSIASARAEMEQNPSNSFLKRLAPGSNADTGAAMVVLQDPAKEIVPNQPTLRIPSRSTSTTGGGLETVAEVSVPSTPPNGPAPSHYGNLVERSSPTEQTPDAFAEPSTAKEPPGITSNEIANRFLVDKADTAPSSRTASTSRPGAHLAKRSITSLTGKAKPAVEPLRSMTIETETVNSTPQIILDRGRDGGSVRTKPSNETIRPKKDKRKPTRKPTSLHAGTHSSKADIFEAKVASAVDEADSSDSDETFVYESNPPEPRHGRHHSRTPSATSLASQVNYYDTRGKHGLRSNSTTNGGRKSMKFSSSIYGNQLDVDNVGDGQSSTRTASSTARHHHISRHGRNGHSSIIDTPFTQSNRPNSPRTPTTRNSRPNSPRTSNGRMHFSRKSVAAGYEAYDDTADDERLPLIGGVRVSRTRHGRRPNGNLRALHFEEDEDPGCWPRFSGCCFLAFIITLICVGVTVFIALLNRTLMDVEILAIKHVLASEQELMLDLEVQAINPNLFTITVNDLDINIFAESSYVGTSFEWAQHPSPKRMSLAERRKEIQNHVVTSRSLPSHSQGGVDKGTDPIDDPEIGPQKMLLGGIFHFDSPLTFSPSPVHHEPVDSMGGIRLERPGNREIGGSERWERVLQHPFDLLVRGVIKYQLPLSSNTRSAQIGGRVRVVPGGDGADGDHRGNTTVP